MARMLIVDDEPKICECLREFFSAKKIEVACVSSGQEAIEWLTERAADVILLDIVLPDISGIDVLKRIKELQPEAKVVMITALDKTEPHHESIAYGAVGYIRKPFDLTAVDWDPVFADLT
ncbi:MAG: response regulator [Candidatus Omnitrophica bacterium]|nr:response regulator [Candidatus Omnitrophota bacterium]